MVISGGVNIYPAEIEAVLLALTGVRDCAVFGIPHEEYGEALCAHIEPEGDAALSEAAVRAFLADRLAGFKVPRGIPFAPDLPPEESGKITKAQRGGALWHGPGGAVLT